MKEESRQQKRRKERRMDLEIERKTRKEASHIVLHNHPEREEEERKKKKKEGRQIDRLNGRKKKKCKDKKSQFYTIHLQQRKKERKKEQKEEKEERKGNIQSQVLLNADTRGKRKIEKSRKKKERLRKA